ncbi:response regulator [Pontibacillus yanchengensis]|uniref:AraC family transcriptional regulator n=1 Tax=Pontibacillus yanchengensis Y32 TaxID=1385514 RepID=A0A0A2TFZ8_9BACI|nr:response regulator [Pontibacillus yanchengensis]KGP74474.1 AraC family transcriptional regulator [Pontibacillus yanchengensis Y32]
MNILIVDDENITRMGLRKTIESSEQFSVVGEASNGKQALEFVRQQHCIDVILLDLNMPIMDGLQFLDYLDSTFQGKVVVLSSYDDLDHVKSAMKKGASDYFHKPTMSPDKITNMLIAISKEETGPKHSGEVDDWMKHLILTPSEKLLKVNHPFVDHSKGKVVILASVNDFDQLNLNDFEIYNSLIQWKEQSNFRGEIVPWREGQYLVVDVLQTKSLLNQYQHIQTLCDSIQRFLKTTKELTLSFGVSQMVYDPLQMNQSVKEAEEIVQQEFFKGRQTLHFYKEENKSEQDFQVSAQSIWQAMDDVDKSALQNELNKYFKELIKIENKEKVLQESFNLLISLKNYMENFNETAPLQQIPIQHISKLHYASDIHNEVYQSFHFMLNWIAEYENNHYSPIVKSVMKYVHQHYTKEISLDGLARHVQTNPSYLSRIFKEQTGSTVSDCIAELRINKAKELLKHNQLRTKDVSLAVGYANERYFSQIFKKYTGMTPTKFRKQK